MPWQEEREKNPRRRAVGIVEISGTRAAVRVGGASADRPPPQGRDIQAAVGTVGNPQGCPRFPRTRQYPPQPPVSRPGLPRGGDTDGPRQMMPCSRKEKNPDALTTT